MVSYTRGSLPSPHNVLHSSSTYILLSCTNYSVFCMSSIRPYYGLSDTFPSNQLLTRTMTGKKRNIYLTSALVRDLLRRNELHVKVHHVYYWLSLIPSVPIYISYSQAPPWCMQAIMHYMLVYIEWYLFLSLSMSE